MMKGRIAIPGRDPKTWRAKGRKRKQPAAMACAIVTPPPMKKRLKGPDHRLSEQQQANNNGLEQPRRSAIVEPKRKPNSMLAHLLADITDAERNRRADLAEAMFREIKRRAALPPDGS